MTITPSEHTDAINSRILNYSEDLITGFHRHPFHLIAEKSELPLNTVLERIKAMLAAGVIRRVRQTLLATKLARGALVAWKIPQEKMNIAFDYMSQKDPFSGHVVLRSTDYAISGHDYRLWSTLKVPQGEKLADHAKVLQDIVGADNFILMPAKGVFTLGVGHIRRRNLPPGTKVDTTSPMMSTQEVHLNNLEWQVLLALKKDFSIAEINEDCWRNRAKEANISLDTFYQIAEQLNQKKVIGRFSTFLEHVKPSATGQKVTKFNGLFHWKVEPGFEEQAGMEIARHHCMTHAYWREGGPTFGNVNIMGVMHGLEKDKVLAHKAAIDQHLQAKKIPFSYTAVFWGGRSEIKPSEISPTIYRQWHQKPPAINT